MEPMRRAHLLAWIIGLVLLASGLPLYAQTSESAPSGMYDLEAECSLRAGIARCVVHISDLEAGEPLFRTVMTTQIGAEAMWRAEPEYRGVPYLFQVMLRVDTIESEMELEVHRAGELVARQRIRTVIVGTE